MEKKKVKNHNLGIKLVNQKLSILPVLHADGYIDIAL